MPEERKLVTVLFSDVVGSTSLGDSLDPEDVRALMGRYFEHARRTVAAYGGTVEKFIGDAVMAVFGLPQAHGDDAERALAAALALREAVAGDPVLSPPMRLRMGVNSGEVMATNDPSRGDFLVSGDTVNVAARLQQYAEAGEIVASERTADAARHAFLFDEPRLVEVKGKPEPLRVFPLREARSTRSVERPPLVGRRRDLLQLSLLQARALEERSPQLVSILAPAGTGKTRLLEEFLAQLDPADGFRVATARCLPYGQTLTYWPLRGLLAGLLGADVERQPVVDVFLHAGYSPEDAARLADLVLATLGMESKDGKDERDGRDGKESAESKDSEGAGDRERIFSAWRLLIEAMAQQAPRIVVFEDLHWASDSLLDLVEQVIHHSHNAPLLIVALSRPELMDRRPNWGGGWRNFTALTLQPLTAEQTNELIGAILTQQLDSVRNQIIERSGGNPFFALELVRGFVERAGTGGNQLPDTVHAAVLARLDLLSPAERAVLQVASVAGRAFRPGMVRAVLSDMEAREIDEALEALILRDFIVPAENGTYAFRHVLFHDVAYGTLSRVKRIQMHTALARWLEETAGDRLDEYTELIAYHYREAVALSRQSAVPLELPIDPALAVRYLRRASELAGRAGAFTEADNLMRSAIDIAPPQEQVALYEQLGDTLAVGEGAFHAYRTAVDLWRSTGAQDAGQGARLLRKMLIGCTRELAMDAPAFDEQMTLLAEAKQLAAQAHAEDEIRRLANAETFIRTRPDVAELVLEQAEEREALRAATLAAADYFEQHGDWSAFSESLDAYGTVSFRAGARADAQTAVRRRLAAPDLPAREYGDAYNVLTSYYFFFGDYANCIATLDEARARLRPGEPFTHMAGVGLALTSAFVSGRWADMDRLLLMLNEVWEHRSYDRGQGMLSLDGFLPVLRRAVAREDRPAADAAFSIIHRIMLDSAPELLPLMQAFRDDDPRKLDEIGAYSTYIRPASVILVFLNERGLPVDEAVIQAAETIPWKFDSYKHYIAIARGRLAGAEAWAAALDEAERHQLVVETARARIALAQQTGDRAQLARARAILEPLGDRQFLRRADEVAAALGDE